MLTGPDDVDPDALLRDAERARVLREHSTNPDVVALTTGRIRDRIDALMWVGILLGLAYTASSVQSVAAGPGTGVIAYSQQWWTAWLITAPVEIPLVAILWAEQECARRDVEPGPWLRRARLGLIGLTLLLNGWAPLVALGDGGTWGALWPHLAVPVAIVLASEAITTMREALGRAITAAATQPRPSRRRTRRGLGQRDERSSGDHRADDDGDDGADGADETDDRTDDTDDSDPWGGTKREAGIAWTLHNWPGDDAEPPMPREIRAALLAQGTSVSRGEASRIRTAAIARRTEASA